ncbi:MAG: 16S rRNA (cytosine(1402)-N(4))-methyltransferase RsmH [Prevotellaceae bacterium]|jgi:16S rRNA (cytosine1402-N4)-methyltransferase|nr:16S rRNA (cytosine(1402)-N(4))-methyltransferase RsmH [Prevotellaceae bacterium]
MSERAYHIPALLAQTIDGLNIKPDGVYVDATFGGGGHAKEILHKLNDKGVLVAFDQDADAMSNVPDDKRVIFVRSNFRYLKNFLKYHNITAIDGLLADLGVSSHHFDEAERGFSFRFEGKPDMRMNRAARLTAADVLNTYPEEKLADVFYLYGEMRQSRRLAKAVVAKRADKPIEYTSEFVDVVKPFVERKKEKKELAQLFQALRMEVNDEMNALRDLLEQSLHVTAKNGRIVALTYHSLEDRLVKNFFRSGNFKGELEKDFYGNVLSPIKALTCKAARASEEEIARNPRARSAKLRIGVVQ